MWSISVDPIPSRIGTPEISRQRENTAAGRGSAAETQALTLEKSTSDAPGARTIAAYSAGTEKNSVGRTRPIVSKIRSGVDRPLTRVEHAPTDSGKDRLLPSPYAWNSLVVE